MKVLAVLIASLAILIGGTVNTAAHSTGPQVAHGSTSTVRLHPRAWTLRQILMLAHALKRPGVMPLQAAATGTPTTPTPVVTPTTSPYPDAQTILQGAQTADDALHSSHFGEVTDVVGTGSNNTTVHVGVTGDATCKGPAFKAKISGNENISGQKSTIKAQVIQIKNTAWIKDKATKSVWRKTSVSSISTFASNPLSCPSSTSASGSGSGTSTFQLKDESNLGPATIGTVSVWHIQATIIDTSANLPYNIDLYIGQQNHLLYKEVIAVQDTTNAIDETLTLTSSKFNEKLTIKKPKVGSA